MNCQEFEELSGAYALGAVTPEERAAAEVHLATCAKCTRLLQGLRRVVELLPLSVTQVTPSPALKERILAAIRRERQPVSIERERGAQAQRRRRTARIGWGARLLAAAAVLLLLLSGGLTAWNVTLQQQNTALAQELRTAEQQNSSLKREVAIFYAIQGTSLSQAATGKLIYIPQQNITLLVMRGLPQLQGTHVYQGWLIHHNKPISAGLLSVQNGVASLTFPGNITGYEMAAVSLEPGPAASHNGPAGPVVATGQLKQPVQLLFFYG